MFYIWMHDRAPSMDVPTDTLQRTSRLILSSGLLNYRNPPRQQNCGTAVQKDTQRGPDKSI